MDDRALGAFQRLERAGDEFGAALDQHLQRHIRRHAAFLDAPAGEIKIGLRGGREADLDFLETHVEEQLEHARLALLAHRVNQRLIAVTQVNRAPDWRLGDLL